jgi:hypothetical protein
MNIYREREKEKGIHINLMRNFTGRERERYQFGEIYRRERERGPARDINFDEHINIQREREGETGISILMKIYRDRERDINFEEKEKQGVLLLVTKSAEVILHKSPTVPNILSLCGRLESGRAGTPV